MGHQPTPYVVLYKGLRIIDLLIDNYMGNCFCLYFNCFLIHFDDVMLSLDLYYS